MAVEVEVNRRTTLPFYTESQLQHSMRKGSEENLVCSFKNLSTHVTLIGTYNIHKGRTNSNMTIDKVQKRYKHIAVS